MFSTLLPLIISISSQVKSLENRHFRLLHEIVSILSYRTLIPIRFNNSPSFRTIYWVDYNVKLLNMCKTMILISIDRDFLLLLYVLIMKAAKCEESPYGPMYQENIGGGYESDNIGQWGIQYSFCFPPPQPSPELSL